MAETPAPRRAVAEGLRRWPLMRGVVVVAATLLALTLVASVALIGTARSLGDAQRYQTNHLDAAQNDTAVLLGLFLDQESGLRGYLLAAEPIFLNPYDEAGASIPRTEDRLQREVRTIPGGTAGLTVVIAAYQAWLNGYAAPQVTRVASRQTAEAQARAESGQGVTLFNRLDAQMGQLRSLLRADQAANEAVISDHQDRLEALLITALAVLAAGIVAVLITTLIRVIRPLRALTASARRVAAGELRADVPESGPAEFRALGSDLAAMRYRLLEEINTARLAAEALQHDGPTVAALHGALIPRNDEVPELLAVGRLDPAEGILAGDWYDLIRIGNSLAVIIGDVSGHGPNSAVLALGLRSVISTVLISGGSPGEALAAAAASVANGSAEHFATVFAAVIDPGADVIRYASAGHPAAIVARAASGGSEELAPTGPLVSPIVARWSWSTHTHAFGTGDRLLAYTDGVTEGRNATNEEYGIERLKADLDATWSEQPTDAVNVIAANVNHFVGASQSDDRTLVYCHHVAKRPVPSVQT